MKKIWILLINVLLMVGIIVFVFVYARSTRNSRYEAEKEGFRNMTISMEQITENYLLSEQHICDVWSKYINSSGMTMDQAVEVVRVSHVLEVAAAHLIFVDDDSYIGLSTRANVNNLNDYLVSYKGLDIGLDKNAGEVGEKLHITRSYINPMNGVQSIAFYNSLTLIDGGTGAPRRALLLRVVPLSELQTKWIYPQDDYKNAEFSMLDEEGNYVIKGESFDEDSFLDYYSAYNKADQSELDKLEIQMTSGTGTINITNDNNEKALIVYTPIKSVKGWRLLGYIPEKEMSIESTDWAVVGTIAAALILLFIADLVFILHFNEQLKKTAEEAERANLAKTVFLSTMSHDIRTPMNAIIGLTTIAEKNIGDPQAVSENLRKISLSSNHLLTLINDILDISKVESGRLTLSPVTFSLAETAENLVNISQPMLKEKNIDFNFRINAIQSESLYADQLRLNQIFINLLSNAIKYTEPGGQVNVDLREDPGSTEDTVLLTYIVSDNGIGMSEEFMKRMYQPFMRETDSRINTIQGTGLGLAITKQMVDLMGGIIDCVSREREGTTFTVKLTLPVSGKAPVEMHLDPMDVLLVDDDEVLRETAKDTLKSLGVLADTADSGAEALNKLKSRRETGEDYGVVIVDWKMPEMDGVEVVRRIRQETGTQAPILLISAYDWTEIEDAAKQAGANGFISKPLFRTTLYNKITEVLGLDTGFAANEEDDSDITGMHILVAEDNDINWEIISEILHMHGIESERAVNGKEAIEMFEADKDEKYDLIFMDIQMPVMNGLDATRGIRSLGTERGSSIPIIAMTADAFSENVAACLEAGMNGHIAKPIDIKHVIKEIRRVKEGRI